MELSVVSAAEQPRSPEPNGDVIRQPTASRTASPHRHAYAVALDHDATPHDSRIVHAPLQRAQSEPPNEAMPPPAEPADMPVFLLAPNAAFIAKGTSDRGRGAPQPSAGVSEPLPERDVDVPARVIVRGAPSYPPDARRAEVEADVPLEIVVDELGRVVSARALARTGYGLDSAAESTVRGYRFSAARREGRPVRVRMHWVVQFHLD